MHLDEDGELFFKRTGAIATHNHGIYLRVSFLGKKYYAHHIVWFLVHGKWPKNIDHRNGDCKDNRISNLREASQSQNIANANFGKKRGIERHGAKWRARIVVRGHRIELGSFATIEEAKIAYTVGALKHFGEFAFHARSA